MTKKQKKSLQQILIALALVILLKLLLRVLPALPTPVELLLYLIPYMWWARTCCARPSRASRTASPLTSAS